MVTHTDTRNFLCSTCGKTFLRSSDLKIHNRLHTGQLYLRILPQLFASCY